MWCTVNLPGMKSTFLLGAHNSTKSITILGFNIWRDFDVYSTGLLWSAVKFAPLRYFAGRYDLLGKLIVWFNALFISSSKQTSKWHRKLSGFSHVGKGYFVSLAWRVDLLQFSQHCSYQQRFSEGRVVWSGFVFFSVRENANIYTVISYSD